jgi:hypothetical protein
MPFFRTLEQLVRPRAYVDKVQNNHPFAWGKLPLLSIPPKDTLLVGDLDAARSIMGSEMQLGVKSDWPDTFRESPLLALYYIIL